MDVTKQISMDEVAKHNKLESAWLVIADDVYDVTKFVKYHPGGAKVMVRQTSQKEKPSFDLNFFNYQMKFAGKDATDVFYSLHRHEVRSLPSLVFVP